MRSGSGNLIESWLEAIADKIKFWFAFHYKIILKMFFRQLAVTE